MILIFVIDFILLMIIIGNLVMVKCPTCTSPWPMKEVVWNMFAGGSGQNGPVEERRQCTSCEENVAAVSFCNECSEWLCEACVQAHKRVRVTKDHTVVLKENSGEFANNRAQHCPKHRSELLKLFCDTCDQLTCRDCQLESHKDHKYSFLPEAAENFRCLLRTYVDKIHEKKTHIEDAKQLIDRRYSDIRTREETVIGEIKLFATQAIAEINKRYRQLVTDLNSICHSKKSQLLSKKNEIDDLSKKIDYGMAFAEFATSTQNVNALLYSKRVLSNQLKIILKSRCEIPNPNHTVDIRFKYESGFVGTQISRQGVILVDGIPFQYASRNTSNAGSMMSGLPGSIDVSQLTREQKTMLAARMRHMQQLKSGSSPAGAHYLPPNVPPMRQTVAHVSPLQASGMDQPRGLTSTSPSTSPLISLALLQQQRVSVVL